MQGPGHWVSDFGPIIGPQIQRLTRNVSEASMMSRSPLLRRCESVAPCHVEWLDDNLPDLAVMHSGREALTSNCSQPYGWILMSSSAVERCPTSVLFCAKVVFGSCPCGVDPFPKVGACSPGHVATGHVSS